MDRPGGRGKGEALADAERAVSLDPGNADTLTALAQVLTTIARPEEAIGFAERVLRVDPGFPGVALFQIGRARYAMGDMEAALSMSKRGAEHLPKVTGHRAMTAAIYARLGRDEEAQREYEIYRGGWGKRPPTLERIVYFYDFRDRAVAERFAKDMIRAGRLPPPHRYYRISDDGRLSGKEIRALFFGRTMTGHSLTDGKQLWVERTRDGTVTLRAGFGTFSGKSWVEDELLCSRYDRLFEGWKFCGPVFRNLDGNPETFDEYVGFRYGNALLRSPVKE